MSAIKMKKDKINKDNKQLQDKNVNAPDKNIGNEDITRRNTQSIRNDNNTNIFLLICIIGVSLAILLEIINVQNRKVVSKDNVRSGKRYWVYSAYNDVENRNGLLKHVHLVLERIGYEKSTNKTPWSLLWSHDYPFRALYPNLHTLNPNQKVNHFPGTGFITNKVDLATSESKFIPKAFKIPKNKKEFLEYAGENRNAVFLEKHNQHRGVYLKNVTAIDLSSGESFVQEYVQKPFLVDGHKFDIGVYVVLTSVNPLRVYYYTGDVLFRFCPAKYYPFDPNNLDKYVVGDDYLPIWKVPSLAHTYTALEFSMKDTFDHYVRSKGKNTRRMWEDVQEAIAEVFINKEHNIIEALRNYPSKGNFFEMMRFDLVMDEDLRVYLLEANMSPNLSSAHYPPNQLLYEQVLYNLFSLVGVTHNTGTSETTAAKNMVSSQKNIAVYSDECASTCRDNCDVSDICKLCTPCLDPRLRTDLLNAHREYLHKGDYRRLFPPTMKPQSKNEDKINKLNEINRLQYLWYQGKCNTDITWCS